MTVAPNRLIKRTAEFQPKTEVDKVPRGTRGIYVLFHFQRREGRERYDVVYVGLSKTGIRGRLINHRRSPKKGARWSHFSIFEVHDNITPAEIGELEGLFRHIYRRDSRANRLNVQKSYGPLRAGRENDLLKWDGAKQ